MRIVASLGIKDEVELIDATIAHLRGIGIDHVVACDLDSTDGTAQLLERHVRGPEFTLLRLSPEITQDEWSCVNLTAVREAEAEWALFLDADEYPVPASGSLRDCAARADADVAAMDRFNVAVGPAGPEMPVPLSVERYDELLLYVGTIRNYWKHLEQHPDTPWTRQPLAGRVMVRPHAVGHIPLGSHHVLGHGGEPLESVAAPDVVVAHLPFTTKSRFARKVANIRKALAAHDELFGPMLGRHWRRWAAMPDRAALDAEFDRMVVDAEALDGLRDAGVVASAAELYARRAVEAGA